MAYDTSKKGQEPEVAIADKSILAEYIGKVKPKLSKDAKMEAIERRKVRGKK